MDGFVFTLEKESRNLELFLHLNVDDISADTVFPFTLLLPDGSRMTKDIDVASNSLSCGITSGGVGLHEIYICRLRSGPGDYSVKVDAIGREAKITASALIVRR